MLSDAGPTPSGGWVDFDVTPAVSGDGRYAFLLRSTSGDGADRLVGAGCASAAADRRDGALAGWGRLERLDRAGCATLDAVADAAQHLLLEREVERLDQGGVEEVGGG